MAGQYDRITQPGEAGKIPLKIRTARLGTKVNKTITVHTNIPGGKASVKIQLKGEVWQPVNVTPRHASFGRLSSEAANKGAVRKLTVINKVEGTAKLTDIRSTNPAFTVEVNELEPGKKFELVVGLVSPLKSGSTRGNIELSTGIPDKPTLKIPVSVFVTADVDITPAHLALRSNRSADLTRRFYVRNYSKAPVTLSDLTSSNPALKLELKETQPGQRYTISVVVPTDYKASKSGDRIAFKTDCPTVPEIVIPVTEQAVRPRRITHQRGGVGGKGPSAAVLREAVINAGAPSIPNTARLSGAQKPPAKASIKVIEAKPKPAEGQAIKE